MLLFFEPLHSRLTIDTRLSRFSVQRTKTLGRDGPAHLEAAVVLGVRGLVERFDIEPYSDFPAK